MGEENNYNLIVQENLENGKLEGLVYITENDLGDCKVKIHQGNRVKSFGVETERTEIFNLKQATDLLLNFLSTKILQILETGAKNSRQKLKDIQELVIESKRRLDDFYNQAQMTSPLNRLQINPFFTVGFELIDKFQELIEGFGDDLENLDIANLSASANAVQLKKNLEIKIIKENKANYYDLQTAETDINHIKHTDKNILKERLRGIEVLKCGISGHDVFDIIYDGDCLCLTFNVERQQNLNGDPWEIVIKDIGTDIVSFNNFIDSELFATKVSQIIKGKSNYVHMEYSRNASELVRGLSDFPINAILPLYISPDHWNISKLRLKSALGYDTSVDVLGFKNEQLSIIPFKLLIHAHENENIQAFRYLKDICINIYLDNRVDYYPVFSEIIDKYMIDYEYRMHSTLRDCKSFIGQLYIAMQCGDFKEHSNIFKFIIQEEFRRKFQEKTKQEFEISKRLLGINVDYLLEKVLHSIETSDMSYTEILNLLANESEQKLNVENDRILMQSRIETLKIEAIDLSNKFNDYLFDSKIVKISELVNIDAKNLENLGLIENEQKLAFMILSLKMNGNNIKYLDIYNAQHAIEFVQTTYTEIINKELQGNNSKIMRKIKFNTMERRANIFVNTHSLEVAAGILLGSFIGNPTFSLFTKVLKNPGIPGIIEKVKMLTHGNYQGIKLLMDKNETK